MDVDRCKGVDIGCDRLGGKGGTHSESSWNSFVPPVRCRVQIGYEGLAPNIELLEGSRYPPSSDWQRRNPSIDRHCSSAVDRHWSSTSIDTVHLQSIDTVHPPSIDTVHLASIDTVHRDTVHQDNVHRGTVHHGIVHPMTDTTCLEAEKVEVLMLKVDENGMLRDEEGRTRKVAGQLINAQGAVNPDVISFAEINDFDLSREWCNWVGQGPFQGLPHQDP
ncbi:hypothetical protein F2Q69_00017919 [Brassica cretica]|uniref:Uncharacterized protein n=1 Tax=Brassica cretica TaxID=69181 RepID=A0A8S9R6S4_BRACR|nr:hypothetical protein F2Q69_00017919 [Brassica cretica]